VRRPSRDDYATPLIVEGRGEEVFECSDDTFGLFHATLADQVAGKLT
jgi:hypothetical protein